jgi:hypothetical protein
MFSLHETTRKRTCRTAFFALCLAPTCATAAWIADHHLPWRTASAARRLSDRYHLEVALTGSEEPRPRMTRTAAVTLAAPHAAEPLLNLTGVETHRRGDALLLSINEVTLAVADLPALAQRLEWTLARTDAARIELHVNALALQPAGGASPVTFRQLKGIIERDAQQHPRLKLIAHLDGKPKPSLSGDFSKELTPPAAQQEFRPPAVSLTVETLPATDGKSPPQQVVTLDAQQAAIPVALLAPLIPGAAGLNPDATFAGVITWKPVTWKPAAGNRHDEPTEPALAGALRGQLAGVDLARLLPQNSSHSLQGRATIDLAAYHWQGDQLQQLAGTLTAADAQANGSFLAAAPSYLGCPPGEPLKPTLAAAQRLAEQRRAGQEPSPEDAALLSATHELSHLACRFTLDAAGLAIEPHIPAASELPAGTLAASTEAPILFCPPLKPSERLPAVAWLQFIASPPEPWIPFTPETLETARRLPPAK